MSGESKFKWTSTWGSGFYTLHKSECRENTLARGDQEIKATGLIRSAPWSWTEQKIGQNIIITARCLVVSEQMGLLDV